MYLHCEQHGLSYSYLLWIVKALNVSTVYSNLVQQHVALTNHMFLLL